MNEPLIHRFRQLDRQQMGAFHFYLSMFPVQLRVVLLYLAEIVLGLLELGFPSLDLLILPGHLQQGLHLVGTDQGKKKVCSW